ncbi:MAG: hypothetical protein VB815_03435 [Dehalococcoidia bacterium]
MSALKPPYGSYVRSGIPEVHGGQMPGWAGRSEIKEALARGEIDVDP